MYALVLSLRRTITTKILKETEKDVSADSRASRMHALIKLLSFCDPRGNGLSIFRYSISFLHKILEDRIGLLYFDSDNSKHLLDIVEESIRRRKLTKEDYNIIL